MFGSPNWGTRPWGTDPLARPAAGVVATFLTRTTVEVIAKIPFVVPVQSVVLTRDVVEVLGSAALYPGMYTSLTREVIEVLGSADQLRKGLDLPGPTVTASTIFLVLNQTWPANGGGFSLRTASGQGLSLTGNNVSIFGLYSDGSSVSQFGNSQLAGKQVLSFQSGANPAASVWKRAGVTQPGSNSGASWSPVALRSLESGREYYQTGSQHLAEAMVFNRALSAAEVTYITAYLTCKWVTPGCNPQTDIGPAP